VTETREFQIATDGAVLHGFRFTPRNLIDAPIVLLIHGAGSRAEELAGFAAQFAEDGIVAITYSMAGYGHSERKGGFDDSDRRHARDLIELIQNLNIKPVLLGTSRGGGIALIAAALGAPAAAVISTGGALDWRGIRDATGNAKIKAWLSGWSDEELRLNSAASYKGRISGPVRLEFGEHEDPEVRSQNAAFAADLQTRGVPVEIFSVPDVGHAYLDKRFPTAWNSRINWLTRLIPGM
jgi:dipeptidyl aminopeptidase/acylaminoacyl peptidase